MNSIPVIKEWKSIDGALRGVIRNGTLLLDKNSQVILRTHNYNTLQKPEQEAHRHE